MDRLYSAEEYVKKGLKFLSYLDKEMNIKVHFSLLNESSGQYKTYYCILYDNRNVLVSEGIGKGINDLWCKASAIYECIEHLVDEPIFFNNFRDKIDIIHVIKADLAEQFQSNPPIPIGNLLENEFQSIPCWEFQLLSDSTQIRHFPWATVSPSYPNAYFNSGCYYFDVSDNNDYEQNYNAVKYASSNGGAIGIGVYEALVHAINELIERDAHSMFLINCFHQNNLNNYFLINHASLPGELYSLLKYIEDKFRENIIVLDITSELEVPTFLCHTTNKSHADQFTGAGTSLSKHYALERALLELLQTLDSSHSLNEITDPERDFKKMCEESPIPFYRKAYSYPPRLFTDNKQKSFTDIVSYSLDHHADFLEKILTNFDIKLYYKSIHIFEDIYKVKCVTPDLEEICLSGHFRLPSSRRGQKLFGIG